MSDHLFDMEAHTLQVLLSSASNEWYTPSIYIEAAREVMGSIDLDPASCAIANETVKATRYYSKAEDGLSLVWHKNIWCNPPYGTANGKSNQGVWIRRAIADYEQGLINQAILLTNAATDAHWFHALFAYPICFTEGRINYFSSMKTDGTMIRGGANTHGSAFTYLGKNEQHFIDIFSQFGCVVRAIGPKTIQANIWEANL